MAMRKRRESQQMAEDEERYAASFLDKPTIPYVKKVLSLLASGEIDQAKFRKILGYVVKEAKTQDLPEEVRLAIATDENLAALCTGVLRLLVCAVKLQVKDAEISRDLQALGMAKEFVDDFVKAYNSQGCL